MKKIYKNIVLLQKGSLSLKHSVEKWENQKYNFSTVNKLVSDFSFHEFASAKKRKRKENVKLCFHEFFCKKRTKRTLVFNLTNFFMQKKRKRKKNMETLLSESFSAKTKKLAGQKAVKLCFLKRIFLCKKRQHNEHWFLIWRIFVSKKKPFSACT